jgi:DNA-binding NarL/FixJ family response regulator
MSSPALRVVSTAKLHIGPVYHFVNEYGKIVLSITPEMKPEDIMLVIARKPLTYVGKFRVLVEPGDCTTDRKLRELRAILAKAQAIPVMTNEGHELTERKKQVLHAIMRGMTNKDIANELHITVRTVKFHVSGLLATSQTTNRHELVRRAAASGKVEEER